MDEKLLLDIGLTEGEVKVYFALLKLGMTKTGALALAAGVSSSKVYKILARLEKKGLVGHVLKGEVKHFTAASPRRILDYIEEKEKELENKKKQVEEMLPELENRQLNSFDKKNAAIFEGFRGIENFYKSILTELKAGDKYYVIGAGYKRATVWFGMRDFFFQYHSKRAKKKIFVKMLANFDERDNLVTPTKLFSEIRYLPKSILTSLMIVFYKNKTFIMDVTKNPVGFLLESEDAASSFKAYFDALWKMSKP